MKVIGATINFFSKDSLSDFCEGLILQFCASYGLAPEDLFCLKIGSIIQQRNENILVCAAGGNTKYINQPLKLMNRPQIAQKIEEAFRVKRTMHEDNLTLFFVGEDSFEIAISYWAIFITCDCQYGYLSPRW